MNIRKKNHPFRPFLCFGLILALLLSLAGCDLVPVTTAPTQSTSPSTTAPSAADPTEPSTAPTTVPATEPTEPTMPTQPTEPPVDPNALVYELTQADIDEFYRLLDECERLALAGEDIAAIEEITALLDEQYEYLDAQCSIALIFYYSDMADETLTQQYLDCVAVYTQANDAYIQMVRRVYESDSPAKETLFEDWTEEDIAQLLAYEEEVALLQQRNAEIEVEYQTATSDDVRIPLYIEFVQNNNKIAQIFGYDNYYTYAYSLVYSRDYSTQELELMRQYAKTYLAGALDTTINNFYHSYGSLTTLKQGSVAEFLYNDYDTIAADYVDKYLSDMPESLRTHVEAMLTADSLFATSANAMPGAFTTMVGDRSYCFFGPGYATSCTVMHEAGHYYASRYADLNSIPLDLAETHSQGNEWLFMSNLKSRMPADQYEALMDYRLYNDLAIILICLMVDEFEQQVYSADLTGFTAQDFDAIMDSVCSQYFSVEYASQNLADLNAYWRLVVVDQPVYYISYAVSAVAAIDLYTMSLEDFDAAVAIYQSLCEDPQEDAGFLGSITAAGLSGPFQESFYQEYVEMINGRAQ